MPPYFIVKLSLVDAQINVKLQIAMIPNDIKSVLNPDLISVFSTLDYTFNLVGNNVNQFARQSDHFTNRLTIDKFLHFFIS